MEYSLYTYIHEVQCEKKNFARCTDVVNSLEYHVRQ